MDLEREMILQAQQDAEGFDPAISTQSVARSESRKDRLEQEIAEMQQIWQEKLAEVREESQESLNELEMREFKTRIGVL